jgi:phosphate acetyltransferase
MAEMSQVIEEADPFVQPLVEKLRRHPKRIVFSDGNDPRVLLAAQQIVRMELGTPVLLGVRDEIRGRATELGIDLTFVNVLDPAEASDLPLFCERLKRIQRYKGIELDNACEVVAQPHHFGAMMIQYGQADGMVAGNSSVPSSVMRAVLRLVKPNPMVPRVYSATVLVGPHLKNFGKDGVLFMADTGVNDDLSVDQLAAIAVETGQFARHYLGRRARVAMLSHSTMGSASTPAARKVAAATELARKQAAARQAEIEIDGEIQADVALDPLAAEVKLPKLEAKPPADVLVFPNLDAAHISLKLLRHVAGARVYGQFIMGLARPAAQVSRTIDATSLFGTALAVGVEAIKYHDLYPDGEIKGV